MMKYFIPLICLGLITSQIGCAPSDPASTTSEVTTEEPAEEAPAEEAPAEEAPAEEAPAEEAPAEEAPAEEAPAEEAPAEEAPAEEAPAEEAPAEEAPSPEPTEEPSPQPTPIPDGIINTATTSDNTVGIGALEAISNLTEDGLLLNFRILDQDNATLDPWPGDMSLSYTVYGDVDGTTQTLAKGTLSFTAATASQTADILAAEEELRAKTVENVTISFNLIYLPADESFIAQRKLLRLI